MTFDPDREAQGLTQESWRPKFFGMLVREGRKFRIASKALKIAMVVISAIVIGVQTYSQFNPVFKKRTEVTFAPPQLRSDMTSHYVPPIMDKAKEARIEIEKRREIARQVPTRAVVIERIQPVRLGRAAAIPAGAEVEAELRSGGTNGMVKAALTEDLSVSGDLLLPKKTVLIGQGSSSEERLYIAFRKAILPDQTVMKIGALAYDGNDRLLGMKGKKVSDYAFRLAASAGLIFLGGMADGLRNDYSSNPFEQRRTTMRDAALNGVSTATSDMSRQTMEGMKNQEARVEVAHSTRLLIIFGDTDAREN